MAAATDLLDAANKASQNMKAKWAADTLKTRTIAFAAAVNLVTEEQNLAGHPIGNWAALIGAIAPSIMDFADNADPGATPYPGATINIFEQVFDYVYRLCKFGYYYDGITAPQKAAILAAYNTAYA